MIHHLPDCTNTTTHDKTDICTYCSVFDHHDFKRALSHDGKGRTPLHQTVLDALKSGKKWRVAKKPNSECGHPGVRDTRGRCVFCLTEERQNNPVWKQEIQHKLPSPHVLSSALMHVRSHIEALKEYEATLEMYIAYGMDGVPTAPARRSPRQIAVEKGSKWYLPFEPCKKCFVISERYVANGKCRNCGK